MIHFFNTLSGKVQEFKPISPSQVKMYTCGPTVYDYAHIGNFRAFVFEDLLRRFLEAKSFKVQHVMNLTDVDDKTIAGAIREKKPLEEYTAKYIQAFQEDLKTLNILPATAQPRATQEIAGKGGMIELIESLIEKGIAYTSEGSVYYRVSKFPYYGKLSKKKLEENIQGARVDVDEYDKEEGSDFVLWKKAKEDEPAWDSPWGKGRPGWHIECSSMSMKYLGETFDLHAGGEDLIFPHHENEIAQSEAATGKPFVHYWMHCKFLLVNGEKMSKSKGNFYTLRDLLLQKQEAIAIRYALLTTHYRTPLNFTLDGLKEASESIKKLDDAYFQCLSYAALNPNSKSEASNLNLDKVYSDIMQALDEDLNISEALAHLWSGVREINRSVSESKMDPEKAHQALAFFHRIDSLLGLDIARVREIPEEIKVRLKERNEVRAHSEFKKEKALQMKSDELRNEIQKQGWLIKDAKPGEISTLKMKRRVWD
jgi:cysteinyl-tRNA synthetase